MDPAQCPYCGSYLTTREPGQPELIWQFVGLLTLFMRWLLAQARYQRPPVVPGGYRCGNCGRPFTLIL